MSSAPKSRLGAAGGESGVKPLVYLADLSHTGQIVASNTHPYGIGLIAAKMLDEIGGKVEVELFKYPDDLSSALERRAPQVMGFANYSWNCNLGYEYARRIKEKFPETVIVFGGPNYGLEFDEQVAFWEHYPLMDFYVLKEGEVAMVELVNVLESYNFDMDALKQDGAIILSCHYMKDGELVIGPLLPRMKDLDDVPSPYLMGIMDKFFDNVLIPMTCTTRGCPFRCTFCTEGVDYYTKVTRRTGLAEDLAYMAPRVDTIQDLIITDANFGMFKENIGHAETIAQLQESHGWPKHIHVSGGKNQKERVLEVATILNGALNVAASLQSTDKVVLANIKRSNISLEQLNHVGKYGTKIDANTYTELILGLPGDSLEAHTNSLRDSVNSGLGFIRMYQLIMLLETNMNTPETRAEFGMETKFRVMPRCFGTYTLFGDEFPCSETEEICVAQDSLSFEDYVRCRELDLTVEITHNANMFVELFGLTQQFEWSWFDVVAMFHENRREHGTVLIDLYDTFRDDTINPLWDSREELEEYAKSNLGKYILDELGTNELFKAKAIAFFRSQNELHDALYSEMEGLLKARGQWDDVMALYLEELKQFSKYRKGDLLNTSAKYEAQFHFDFQAIMAQEYVIDPQEYMLDRPVTYSFSHLGDQKRALDAYVYQYGTTVLGLGRILLRAHVKRLFRNFRIEGASIETAPDRDLVRRALNLYGE
ncbi:MAG: radical SAM protein [Nitrospirales bacterium]